MSYYYYCSSCLLSFFLSLAPQPSLGLGLLHRIRLNFLEASQQFSFLQGRVVSPTPNHHPRGPGLCIYIPQRQSGYPFYSPLTTRMGYGGTILIPRSPHGELLLLSAIFHVYPPNQWVPGALSLGVKRPGGEAGHSPPFSAEVKE
jgi:hypothetical protein